MQTVMDTFQAENEACRPNSNMALGSNSDDNNEILISLNQSIPELSALYRKTENIIRLAQYKLKNKKQLESNGNHKLIH